MILIDIEAKHTQLYNKLMSYLHEHNMQSMNDWDEEANIMWARIKQYRQFCEDYFNIDEETLEFTLPNA